MIDNGGKFVKTSLELASEIAEKGSRGEQLTKAEQEFVKQSTLMVIGGLLGASNKKSEITEAH